VNNNSVEDLISGKQGNSDSPQFFTDRFGTVNGSIYVNSIATVWKLPAGAYFQGDTTLTMWVKKMACSSGGSYGN
jgi:hypothetical protein